LRFSLPEGKGHLGAAPWGSVESPEQLYPVRAPVPWVREEGCVVVLLPKPLGPLGQAARALTKGPGHVRVPLDEVGTRAFLLADGSRTAGTLAEDLEREFGERAGPRERALAFVATLARNGLVQLAREPTPAPSEPAALRQVACTGCRRALHVADPPGTRLRCPGCGRKLDA
jgi:hypothetical protein